MAPSEDSLCQICSFMARLWGKNKVNEQTAAARLQPTFSESDSLLLIRHGLLQSPDAVQLEPVEGLRHLSPSKVYE